MTRRTLPKKVVRLHLFQNHDGKWRWNVFEGSLILATSRETMDTAGMAIMDFKAVREAMSRISRSELRKVLEES